MKSRIPNLELSNILRPLLFSSFLTVATAVSSIGQTEASQSGSFKLRVDVDLVTVEVSVLDGKGSPVRNLKRDDFRVYENGKEQEILSFDAVDGEEVIPPSALPIVDNGDMPRGKTVLIIFDAIPDADHLRRVRDSAARFVREHMRPQDYFAVALWGGTMRIVVNLTDDREAVLAAIAQVSPAGWGPFETMLTSLEEINNSIESLKGQKSVLIFGRSSSMFGGAALSDRYRRVLSSAKQANVIYYAVYPENIIAPIPESGQVDVTVHPPEPGNAPANPKIVLRSATFNVNTLASDSGGFSVNDPGQMDTALDRLNRQISSYYILGFQSSNQKHDGAFRRFKVTTRVKGANLKYPPGYQDRRPIDVLASSRQEQRLQTALATPGTLTQLPVAFRPAYFYASPRLARVLIAAKIRTEKMTLKKKGGQLGTDLHIMGAAYAENGGIAAKFNETVPISFDRGKEAEFRGRDFAYRNYVRLRPGKYRLKLAIADESDKLGSMEQSIEVPALPEQGIAVSSLVLAEQTWQLPGSVQNLRAQLLDGSDPLLYPGIQIEPCVDNRVPVNSPVTVLFRVYNTAGSNLIAAPKLLGDKGEKFELAANSLKDIALPAGPSEAVVGLRLPFANVPPGKYRLVIDLTETGSAQTATLQTELEFIP